MRVRVRHLARYRYDAPVALGPHLLRLTPRGQSTMAHGIRVSPAPAFRLDETDVDGNRVTRLGFEGRTNLLEIECRFELDTRAAAPAPGGRADPEAYLARGPGEPRVEATAARLRALAGSDPAGFAESLAEILHSAVDHEPRETGPVCRPGETLARGRGTTRDIAALYVELARRAGLPARFVAGYWVEGRMPGARRGLHVWAEVLLPNDRWRGIDPSLGTRCGEGHVAVAAAPGLAGTLPVTGSTFGNGIRVSTGFELDIVTPG